MLNHTKTCYICLLQTRVKCVVHRATSFEPVVEYTVIQNNNNIHYLEVPLNYRLAELCFLRVRTDYDCVPVNVNLKEVTCTVVGILINKQNVIVWLI